MNTMILFNALSGLLYHIWRWMDSPMTTGKDKAIPKQWQQMTGFFREKSSITNQKKTSDYHLGENLTKK